MNWKGVVALLRERETHKACTTRSRCCNFPTHRALSYSCLLYMTIEMDWIASKALQCSWTALVFAPLFMVPLCFVFQAAYRKSLLGFALSKETYLFPHTPPSSYPLWISTRSRLWSGLSERNSGPDLMSLLWSKSNAIYRHSLLPVHMTNT